MLKSPVRLACMFGSILTVQACLLFASAPTPPNPCPHVEPQNADCGSGIDNICFGAGGACNGDRKLIKKEKQPILTKMTGDDEFTYTDPDIAEVKCYTYYKCSYNQGRQECNPATATVLEEKVSPMQKGDC